ncbi:MAG TPA: PfaD family polyunsaturated fatty acid/polyketide biosynthesis protein [Kineosporiaceae bacterium]|nr:PfaD family polyunsaturated fatty acid/polyketide biosynthesis protein [Kineosporiaceae bacterium]
MTETIVAAPGAALSIAPRTAESETTSTGAIDPGAAERIIGRIEPHSYPVVARAEADVLDALRRLDLPLHVIEDQAGIGLSHRPPRGSRLLAYAGPADPVLLGDVRFLAAHGVRAPLMAGAMANGIASKELVVEQARAGYLGSFGAAGLLPERIDATLTELATLIPGLPFACNLIHAPSEERLERTGIDLFLKHRVRCVEASAFMDVTRHVVRYRALGLRQDRDGTIRAENRLIAKLSRAEVAEKFLAPAPAALLAALVADGEISAEQALLAARVPLADDLTVEADSGGHTDRRPLSALFPSIVRLRDRLAGQTPGWVVRVGAAGGIATPEAVLAAFTMGAAYVVTGSVNQSCIEAGTSTEVKEMLATAGVADVDMAPAADMFELGVELQVLRRGTMFAARARRLRELYRTYDGLEAIPDAERAKLEQQLFRRPLTEVWAETAAYFARRDPAQLARAEGDPKRRMALVFRWYLGMSSRWSTVGEAGRGADYQIWCGPAMGAFNDWVRGSYLEPASARRVADVSYQLLAGAGYLARVEVLRRAGVGLPAGHREFRPQPLDWAASNAKDLGWAV